MGRLKIHAAGLIVLLVCLLKMPSNDAITTYIFAFKVGVYIAVTLWVARSDLFVGLFLVLGMISILFFNGNPFTFTLFMFYSMWFLFLINYVKDIDILDYISIVLVLHVAFMALQVFHGDPWAFDIKTHGPLRVPCGLVADINASSALVGICAPALLKYKKWWRLLFIIPVFGLVLSKAFTGVFALSVSIIAYFLFAERKRDAVIALGACSFGVLSFILFVDAPGIPIRILILEKSAELFPKVAFMGVGLGQFAVELPGLIEHYAHNELVDYTIELGFLVPALFIGWLYTTFKKGDPIVRAGLVASVAASLVYFTTHNPIIAFVIVTWAATGKMNTGVTK